MRTSDELLCSLEEPRAGTHRTSNPVQRLAFGGTVETRSNRRELKWEYELDRAARLSCLIMFYPKLRSLDPRPRARRRPYGSAEVIHNLGPKLPGSQFWSVSDPRL